jgi:hypothetical protein
MLQDDVQLVSIDDHVIKHQEALTDSLATEYLKGPVTHGRAGGGHPGLQNPHPGLRRLS